jgi:hypothetical protein
MLAGELQIVPANFQNGAPFQKWREAAIPTILNTSPPFTSSPTRRRHYANEWRVNSPS